jgi:hypothetical protein
MNLFDAFNLEEKKTKKLDLEALRALCESIVTEKATPENVDPKRFPIQLSKAANKAGEAADKLVTGGAYDGNPEDDIVTATPGSMPVKSLKPSQSSMNIEKACQFAICAILKVKPFPGGPGGDLGAIITSDNHIMDGHHRWIATGMVDPNASVGGYVVEFPAKEMIAALNMITVSLGITKGKPGSGGFDQFNSVGIEKALSKLSSEGFWGANAEECQRACELFTGMQDEEAVKVAAEKMAENVSRLELSVPAGFPARPDMPVISKGAGHLAKAIAMLRSGAVDLNKPYAKNAEEKNESANLTGEPILENWKKLAGLL